MASRALRAAGATALVAATVGAAPLPAQERDALVAEGIRVFAERACYGCHTLGVAGTPIAPDLSRAGLRYREADLARWLRDPAAQPPTRHMPQLLLSEAEARALAAYLATLR